MTINALSNSIEHPGVITEITADTIKVSIISTTACSSCHSKSSCMVSDQEIKIIDVVHNGQQVQIGDHVNVAFQKSLGPLAILLGYLVPFFLLILILTISWSLTNNEALSGVFSLAGVAVYYGLLSLFRTKLKGTFLFTIQKG